MTGELLIRLLGPVEALVQGHAVPLGDADVRAERRFLRRPALRPGPVAVEAGLPHRAQEP